MRTYQYIEQYRIKRALQCHWLFPFVFSIVQQVYQPEVLLYLQFDRLLVNLQGRMLEVSSLE